MHSHLSVRETENDKQNNSNTSKTSNDPQSSKHSIDLNTSSQINVPPTINTNSDGYLQSICAANYAQYCLQTGMMLDFYQRSLFMSSLPCCVSSHLQQPVLMPPLASERRKRKRRRRRRRPKKNKTCKSVPQIGPQIET